MNEEPREEFTGETLAGAGGGGESVSSVPTPVIPPDDIVEKTLERAAEKVAAVTVPGGTPVMSRNEGFVVVAVLVILNLASGWLSLQAWSETKGNNSDHKIICQLVNRSLPTQDRDVAEYLAKCIK